MPAEDHDRAADRAPPKRKRPWQEELAIIDRTMRAISGVTDPEELVKTYWDGIGELIAINDFVALSRRDVAPPFYLITRSSRFAEEINPWTERERLPRLSGGLLGEIAYGDRPVIIEDLPSRLRPDDPARFYLEGFGKLVALPQYDGGVALNYTTLLLPPDADLDLAAIPAMHWHAGLFGRGTQNLVLRNRLAGVLADLDRELQAVGNIQRSLLPAELPEVAGFGFAAHYETSARAGGDYYDFFPLGGGRLGLFIADVSGHGTPAAVVMAITHAIAHARPGTHAPPGALLESLNDQLARAYTRDGTFVTAFYAVLDPSAGTLTYARAGHNPPRLARGEQVLSLEEVGALPLGIAEGESYDQATLRLERGDLLLLYTDGVTEATSARDESVRFGVDRLDELLRGCGTGRPGECIDRIRDNLAAFTDGAPPNDDRTMVAMRVG